MAKQNKIFQPEQIVVKRSDINFASYNPRVISEDARKKIKKNMREVGLLGGIVWNKRTGNLVSGHQRVSIMDSVNRYNAETHDNDYEFRVEVVDLDLKAEKEQNLFLNNPNVQGEYDNDLLRKMLSDIDYIAAGFEDFDLEMLGLKVGFEDIDVPEGEILLSEDFSGQDSASAYPEEGNAEESPQIKRESLLEVNDTSDVEHGAWRKEMVTEDNEELASHDEMTKGSEENKKIDRSTNFYADTEANKIARHNEVQKIKDRINSQNNINKDGGMLSYVVLSFGNVTEKMSFMNQFGYDPMAKYVDGAEFQQRLEFGDFGDEGEDYDDEDEDEDDVESKE